MRRPMKGNFGEEYRTDIILLPCAATDALTAMSHPTCDGRLAAPSLPCGLAQRCHLPTSDLQITYRTFSWVCYADALGRAVRSSPHSLLFYAVCASFTSLRFGHCAYNMCMPPFVGCWMNDTTALLAARHRFLCNILRYARAKTANKRRGAPSKASACCLDLFTGTATAARHAWWPWRVAGLANATKLFAATTPYNVLPRISPSRLWYLRIPAV